MKKLIFAVMAASIVAISAATAADVPPEGASERIDAIKARGSLRVGVLANPPWLMENTTGAGGEIWAGPSWTLANEYANRLGVTVEPVAVSNETKIPVLPANQVDITITPLAVTQDRLPVVDFVLFTQTALCVFGRADNPKIADAQSIDDLNRADISFAIKIGGADEQWAVERFPEAEHRRVAGTNAPFPLEEIVSGRADVGGINRIQWIGLSKRVPGLMALPRENDCQDSQEKAAPVGFAVSKNQPVFLEWLNAVKDEMQESLTEEELRLAATMQ
ncbi:MAG: transporter substrate-binding domain-containing protein [Pseudaminobacter sp.]